MNSNYNLELEAEINYEGNNYSLKFDPYNDCTDMDGLKDLLIQEIVESGDFEEPINEDNIEIRISDFAGIPEKYANEKRVWDFAQAFAECEQDEDVVIAALDCDVEPGDIDEAYAGEFGSDEDFAEDMADQIGAVDKNAVWPMNCIDWAYAAKELMYDYSSSNGYYFRSM